MTLDAPADLVAVVLCGGRGTRAYPHTVDLPKPLLEVAGTPILRHVLDIFAGQGCHRFVLAAGFRADLLAQFAQTLPGEWDVVVKDGGVATDTGDRILGCRDLVGPQFFATYGDGLSDIDLGALLDFHCAHTGTATLTTVPLPSPYGVVNAHEDGRVTRFVEKPKLESHPINGGFFVFDRAVFDLWSGTNLEQQVLPVLARSHQLYSYRHQGFWRSLDTYKDAVALTELCHGGKPPWLASTDFSKAKSGVTAPTA